MPVGIYKHKPHSEETKRKMSIANKIGKYGFKEGYHSSTEFKKGCINWNRGLPSEMQPHYKGGRCKTAKGYIIIKNWNHPFCDKQGYLYEHRVIIEKQIKRFLLPYEKSHHLNGIKTDNKPQNLIAFTSEAAHQRFHFNPNNVEPEEIIFDGRKYKTNKEGTSFTHFR